MTRGSYREGINEVKDIISQLKKELKKVNKKRMRQFVQHYAIQTKKYYKYQDENKKILDKIANMEIALRNLKYRKALSDGYNRSEAKKMASSTRKKRKRSALKGGYKRLMRKRKRRRSKVKKKYTYKRSRRLSPKTH